MTKTTKNLLNTMGTFEKKNREIDESFLFKNPLQNVCNS